MNTRDVVTLAAVGGAAWFVWRLLGIGEALRPLPPEARGNHVVPRSGGAMKWGPNVSRLYDWYLGQGYEPLSAEEAARTSAVAEQLNADLGWSPTRGGIW